MEQEKQELLDERIHTLMHEMDLMGLSGTPDDMLIAARMDTDFCKKLENAGLVIYCDDCGGVSGVKEIQNEKNQLRNISVA